MKSVYDYVVGELSRGYLLERDEAMLSEKQRRVVTFMKTPRELEKLMLFGFLICLDAFLFILTFLPIRVLLSLSHSLYRFSRCRQRWIETCDLCDIFRVSILLLCIVCMGYVDTSAVYHIVRAQSVIKLYVIYNMLEIFDRLLASIGQDTLDSLFWSAVDVEGKEGGEGRKPRDYLGAAFYYIVATGYVLIHTVVLLFQTVTLNVAVNSHSKALLTIMVSNNFVELKGSVFKKFERSNLFQMSCSDIRERFHYVVLLGLVSVRNLAQFNWDPSYLHEVAPVLLLVLVSEVFVDWTKHAFITKFNDISPDVYQEYRSILAKDLASSQHQQAKSDHSDLVSRRMGFIPLPLICLVNCHSSLGDLLRKMSSSLLGVSLQVWRTLSQSFSFPGSREAALVATIYLW
ncbi:Transmembrane anterior posterior transformation protein 1 [Geodia barretti]|uniref:Transmembrane anterior posterior transformation protein 1 n=1 Tax=Geodia barretti TaxID=519541 RepID=A0AA35WAT8_GEOBA|nr:Transmembrane anterior posterior transformation protein 1 [Geodia barretti]